MVVLPILADYLELLDERCPNSIIPWACPVPYFGGARVAQVATVGINPSNLEFMDHQGQELDGSARRLPTLRSLGLSQWKDANSQHLRHVVSSFDHYFVTKPYDRWFGVLERVLQPGGCTYYGHLPSACHLDLFALATRSKWNTLGVAERQRLLRDGSQTLALLVRFLPIRFLLLNGRSVVQAFEMLTGTSLASKRVPSWDLPRATGTVPGLVFTGSANKLAGIPLGRTVTIVGYNHNLQSSFGVTSRAIDEIGTWFASLLWAHR